MYIYVVYICVCVYIHLRGTYINRLPKKNNEIFRLEKIWESIVSHKPYFNAHFAKEKVSEKVKWFFFQDLNPQMGWTFIEQLFV